MVLQYSAVGIQNESHMATDISGYWKDLERLETSIGYAVWNCSLDLPYDWWLFQKVVLAAGVWEGATNI